MSAGMLRGLLSCTAYKTAGLVQKRARAQLGFGSNFAAVSGADFEALPSTELYSHETKGNVSLIISCVAQTRH